MGGLWAAPRRFPRFCWRFRAACGPGAAGRCLQETLPEGKGKKLGELSSQTHTRAYCFLPLAAAGVGWRLAQLLVKEQREERNGELLQSPEQHGAGGVEGASTARLQGPVLGGEGFLQAPRGSFGAVMLRLADASLGRG